LPVPVDPAISKCACSQDPSREFVRANRVPSPASVCWMTPQTPAPPRFLAAQSFDDLDLALSMPIVDFPDTLIKIDSACSARHKSSVNPVIRLYLIPASGLNSNVVTLDPDDLRHASLHIKFQAFFLYGPSAIF